MIYLDKPDCCRCKNLTEDGEFWPVKCRAYPEGFPKGAHVVDRKTIEECNNGFKYEPMEE